MKCLFDLVVSNGGWENSLICGKKLDFLHLANNTFHRPIGPIHILAINGYSSAIEMCPLKVGFTPSILCVIIN